MNLHSLYKTILLPASAGGVSTYSVKEVEAAPSYLLGKDASARPALLVQTATIGRLLPAIKLKSFEAYFGVQCSLQNQTSGTTSARLAVIVCPAQDDETIRFFLSVCTSLIGLVGNRPEPDTLWAVANRIASLFQKLSRPPTRSVNGLFGELLTIWRSIDPVAMTEMWRAGPQARFDFAGVNLRVDVKTTTGRVRSHILSFEQANPPAGTLAIIASMFIERVGNGLSLGALLRDIEEMLSSKPQLLLKLQEQTAETLGDSLQASLELQFDLNLSRTSFRLFRALDIPAVRGDLPAGVSSVHFTSDLSAIGPVSSSILCLEAEDAYPLAEALER